MNAINLAKKLKRYKEGWVSITKDYKKVIAYSRSLEGLLLEIAEKKNPDGIILKTGRSYDSYVG